MIFTGSGTGGWEAALTNTLSPGDKVLSARYGQFSHLWTDMAERLGLDVQILDADLQVHDAGVRSDTQEVARVARVLRARLAGAVRVVAGDDAGDVRAVAVLIVVCERG